MSFETNIDVADKRQRLDVRRQTVKISEFAEEAGGYSGRARAINDGDEKRHRVAGNASSDELERGRLNADVNRRRVKSRNDDNSDTAVVGTECIIDSTRSGSLNDREPVGA